MAILPSIPTDILAAEISLRDEFINYIDTLIDAAEPALVPGGNNDLVFGTAAANIINGQSGNDVIAAFAGNDSITGGFGDDYILAGIGDDRLFGGDGNDFLFGEAGNDILDGADGDDAMFGGAGNDTVTGGEGNDWMYGNGGADRMTGGFGDDLLDGGAGGDVLIDDTGNDTLLGGAGNDRLTAGADNDILWGGAGADRLSGGTGNDVYVYNSRTEGNDIILDFVSGNDAFNFAGLGFRVDPGTDLEEGVTFVANGAPGSVVAEATVLYNTDSGQLWFDVDGTGAASAQLIATVQGAPNINAQDFIFF